MHKFFVPKENISGNKACISGEDVKHIYKVLRLKPGDKVSINNCCAQEFLGIIKSMDKKQVQVEILEKLNLDNESGINIYLFQGFPKSSKMDLILQKATELGVKEIIPVFTERVVVKNKQGELKKSDRWNRIVKEACKQCKRSIIPKVHKPADFNSILELLKNMDIVVVPYENEHDNGIKHIVQNMDRSKTKSIAVVIGPEGGFAGHEIDALKEIGADTVTLGPRILRTETAGFVCVSILMYELGDLGGSIS